MEREENIVKYEVNRESNICKNEENTHMSILISRHAQQRLQQRGISIQAVPIIRRYGKRTYVNGAESYSINKSDRPSVERHLKETMSPEEYSKVSKDLDCYIIVKNNNLVTAAHRTQRLRN